MARRQGAFAFNFEQEDPIEVIEEAIETAFRGSLRRRVLDDHLVTQVYGAFDFDEWIGGPPE